MPPKSARLEARITPDLQALLTRAAELEGRSVAFVEAILDPPEPTGSLRRAFARHKALIAESR